MSQEKLETIAFNDSVRRYWIRGWVYNMVKNEPHLKQLFKDKEKQALIGSAKTEKKKPALVLGAGPSLDEIAPRLGEWRGTIFIPNSLTKWCDAIGRHAEYIIAIDASREIGDDLQGPHYHRSTLLTHPAVDPHVFESFDGPIKLFRMFEPGNEIINILYATLYPWIEAYVINSGCVTNAMILIASLLGYSPLYLLGHDFAYPDGVMRFQDFNYRGNFTYLPKQVKKMVNHEDPWEKPQLLTSDEGLLTTRTMVFYKQTFLCNYKLTGAQLINMSEKSILKPELPFAPLDEVLKAQTDKKLAAKLKKLHRSRAKIDEVCDNYLVPRGIYAKYHKEIGAILGIEIVSGMPQKLAQWERELRGTEEAMKQWTPPSKEKPYWTREGVTLTEIPDWEWKDEPDNNDTVQDQEQPVSGENAKESTREDIATNSLGTTQAPVGDSTGNRPSTGK